MPESPNKEASAVPLKPITANLRARASFSSPALRRVEPPAPGKAPASRPSAASPIAPIAPGVNRGATLSGYEMDLLRGGASRARRKMLIRRWSFVGATSVAVILAFSAGFLWKKSSAKAPSVAAAEPVAEDRRHEAVVLMDRAVRAKHEEKFDDAISTVAQARQADPGLHGGDTVLAEIALRRGDSPVVRRAAREALNRGENPADANLLLAVDSWQARGLPGGSTGAAGDAALLRLVDAEAAELSNGNVRFFQGDLLRELGRNAEAQRSLLGGLHRQQPWTSVSVIAAKQQLAGAEAGNVPTSTPAGDAMVALREALRAGEEPRPFIDQLRAVVSEGQSLELLQDAAFDGPDEPDSLVRARSAEPAPIPHGRIEPPDMTRRAKSYGY